MPERIEAQVISESLNAKISGLSILSVQISDRARHTNLDSLVPKSKVIKVKSYGKKVIMELSNNQYLITSLGMTGAWSYTNGNHNRVIIDLGRSTGRLSTRTLTIYYQDARNFGNLYLTNDLKTYLSDLGPDIFLGREVRDSITSQSWLGIFRNPKIKNWQICKAMMDQTIIAGVGNYLKAEILYRARLAPDRLVSDLQDNELETLRVCTMDIPREVYEYKGLTISTYWSPDGTRGSYPVKVYKRETDDEGNEVVTDTFKDSRTTHWVPDLQCQYSFHGPVTYIVYLRKYVRHYLPDTIDNNLKSLISEYVMV